MIKIHRSTEYALLALRHLSLQPLGGLVSAREISEAFGLPFEITAKTLQKLKDFGFIEAAYGVKGGYFLKRPLSQVTLADFLEQMEGPQAIVMCVNDTENNESCKYGSRCDIREVMGMLNKKVSNFLSNIYLEEICQKKEQK